ncbi:MAG: hypothetical protein IJI22_01035 [Bacilli bacterium]|nr:hypothetical protein [Bacilli bacterium]
MKKLLTTFLVLLSIFLLTGCVDKNSDAYKFKTEYESMNGEKSQSGKEYRTLKIDNDNPFVYSTTKEIVEMMDNKETFIVYFGFKECPWCRSVLEQLIKAAKDNNVEKIYYVDVKEIRDVKELVNGEIKTTKEGDSSYMTLIEKMSDVLDDYTLTNDNNEKIEVGEKRIYAPNVVAISKGKAIQLETGISDELTDPYMELTTKIKKYAYNKFKCLITCLEEASTTCQKNSC